MTVSRVREGDYFAVPLPLGGYGVGIAARIGARGIVLGYFSSVKYNFPPKVGDVEFSVTEAIWVELFGDLGFVEGRWLILGAIEDWQSGTWPLPDFAHHEEITGRCYRISFNGDLDRRPQRTRVGVEDVIGLSEYGVGGFEYVEIRLEKLLT